MTAMPLPVPCEPQELRQLTYAPLPYETHPIDLAYGSQGWGPFPGPWTPEDFMSPFWGIDITWYTGDNRTDVAPGYQDLTVFRDPSLDSVANSSFLATLERDVRQVFYTNTAAQGATVDSTPQQSSRLARLAAALGVAT